MSLRFVLHDEEGWGSWYGAEKSEKEPEMKIICAWCSTHIGTKPGTGVSHGVCSTCFKILTGESPEPKEKNDK